LLKRLRARDGGSGRGERKSVVRKMKVERRRKRKQNIKVLLWELKQHC